MRDAQCIDMKFKYQYTNGYQYTNEQRIRRRNIRSRTEVVPPFETFV